MIEEGIKNQYFKMHAYLVRGMIYLHTNQLQEALSEADYILSRDPNFARAYLLKASIYSFPEVRNYEEQLLNINKAIELNPTDPEFYEFRGRTLGGNGNYREALYDFNKAIELRPNYATNYDLRSIVYKNLAEQAESQEQRIEYLELMRRDIETYRRLSGL